MKFEERKFDVRTVERNIKKGIVSREEYEAYLSSLEDCELECQEISSEIGVPEPPEEA